MKIIVSNGYSNGWGSAPFKTVHGLTADERAAVRDGSAVVVITGCPLSGGGNGTGTTVREVFHRRASGRDRYYHRVPSDAVLGRFQALEGLEEMLVEAEKLEG